MSTNIMPFYVNVLVCIDSFQIRDKVKKLPVLVGPLSAVQPSFDIWLHWATLGN